MGGHLLYKEAMGKLLACDCVCPLAPITTSEMKIKVKKERKWMNWEMKVKIEILTSLILSDCWSGVVESSSLGFSMQGSLCTQWGRVFSHLNAEM